MIFFKLLLGFASIAIIIFNIVKGFTPNESHEKKIRYIDSEVVLSHETNTSITFKWQSQESEVGSIEYGILPNVYYQSHVEENPTHMHEIRLDLLKACTKYYYHISSESMLFDIDKGSFTSPCGNGKITNE